MNSEPGPSPAVDPPRRGGGWLLGLGPAIIPLGVALLCFIGFGLPLVLVLNARDSASPWVETRAEVVEVEESTQIEIEEETRRRREVTRYTTIVRYAVDGEEYVRTVSYELVKRYRVGEQITVHYRPDAPTEIRTDDPAVTVPWVLGGLGSGFVLIFGTIGLVLLARGVSWGPGRGHRSPVAGPPADESGPDPRTRRKAGRVMIIIGVASCAGLLIAAGIIGGLEYRKTDWSVTEGTVVGSSIQSNESGGMSYAPRVAYTVDGREFVHTSSVYGAQSPEVGRAMEVRYDPADPATASVVNLGWVALLLLGIGIGVLVLCGGIGLMLGRR